MRRGQFDARARGVDEVQQRRSAAESSEFRAPSGPSRLTRVAGNQTCLAEAERVRRGHLHRGVQRAGFGHDELRVDTEVAGGSIGTPHTATLSA